MTRTALATDARELRARVIYDPDPDWSWLTQPEFGWDGETYGPYGPVVQGEEYVALAVVAEELCPCCGRWDTTPASLWGISVLDSDRSLIGVPYEGDPETVLRHPSPPDGTYTVEELRSWLDEFAPGTGRHHLATGALEVLDEARADLSV